MAPYSSGPGFSSTPWSTDKNQNLSKYIKSFILERDTLGTVFLNMFFYLNK
jgi:hypothetical protein